VQLHHVTGSATDGDTMQSPPMDDPKAVRQAAAQPHGEQALSVFQRNRQPRL